MASKSIPHPPSPTHETENPVWSYNLLVDTDTVSPIAYGPGKVTFPQLTRIWLTMQYWLYPTVPVPVPARMTVQGQRSTVQHIWLAEHWLGVRLKLLCLDNRMQLSVTVTFLHPDFVNALPSRDGRSKGSPQVTSESSFRVVICRSSLAMYGL